MSNRRFIDFTARLLLTGVTALRHTRLAMVGLLLGLPAIGQGAVLTFAFEGSVTSFHNTTGAPVNIQEGDRMIYTYSFDSDSPGYGFGFFKSYTGISSTLTIGATTFNIASAPGIDVQHPVDSFAIGARFNLPFPQLSPNGGSFGVSLANATIDVFADNTLPETPPPLAPFQLTAFGLNYQGAIYDTVLQLQGSLDRSYQIPEPTVLLLILSGVAVRSMRRGSSLKA